MPVLYKDEKKNKILFLQFERCKGCGLCIEACPRKVLKEGEKTNARIVNPPEYAPEGDKNCTLCESCMLVCPDFAIYVVEAPANE
ncbi:MAG: 4Fe-4S dicluster domain-containing protein [Candidatus Lokiarchaeota archaeon]|nr:4Fe-4S dicluster domain-containing protein [Candidatus Lokiarchaeota archaeon]